MEVLSEIQCRLNFGTFPDQIVALMAIGTGIFVIFQLRSMHKTEKAATKAAETAAAQAKIAADAAKNEWLTARSTLMLSIDEQYESGSVSLSRLRWVYERRKIRIELASTKPDYTESDIQQLMAHRLNRLWEQTLKPQRWHVLGKNVVEEYLLLTQFPNWLETIGRLSQDNKSLKDDILSVYRSVILPIVPSILYHLEHRRHHKPGTSSELWANAKWLYDEARKSDPDAVK